jgi:heme-degrading monooxygenase HmoA
MADISVDKQPVTQITLIEVAPGEQDEALGMMEQRARFMATQPGFVSISLHRSLDGRRIVNYVQWQDGDLLRAAHQSPQFRKEWQRFDDLTEAIDPHLYEVAAVIEGARGKAAGG